MYKVYTKEKGPDNALIARSEEALKACIEILSSRGTVVVEETNTYTLNDPMEQ